MQDALTLARRAQHRALRKGLSARNARLEYQRTYRREHDRSERERLKRVRLERMLAGFEILKNRLKCLQIRLRKAAERAAINAERRRGSFAGRPRTWLER